MSVVEEIVMNYLDGYTDEIKNNMSAKNRNASKRFINSLKRKVATSGDTVTGQVTALEYFKWLDQGRASGKFPPVQDIEAWIQEKGIAPFVNAKGKPLTPKSQAFIIARKIAREGTTLYRTKQNDMVIASALQSKPIKALAQELLKAKVQGFKQMVRESLK